MHTYSLFNILVIFELLWDFSDCLFLSLSFLFTLVVSMAPKRKSTLFRNPLRSGASSSSNPTPSHFGSVMRMPEMTSWRTFLDEVFIRNAESFLADFADTDLPNVIHSRGWESLCDVPVTCTSMLIQEFYSNMHGIYSLVPLFYICVRGTRIVVTPELVSDVLHVPRVEHPDYPECERLRTVSKVEMMSAFCERPSIWGDHQFTPYKTFA